ncbi:pregnancy-specific beta-1-glyco 7 [Pelobates cultripes]|uniref:Pregnancy-specific beta-1-glyco 7 n=2 Tax=Pelobates cultripes TaxID=61616 RepID=A0AAD1WUG9_PELCU|nr:pregnancy-specific beta-1-glyco 7 [Pelobates cultripes]
MWCMVASCQGICWNIMTALLLLPVGLSSGSDIVRVAVGSDLSLCGMTCVAERTCLLRRLEEAAPFLDYDCDLHYWKTFNNYGHRTYLNISSGCAVIRMAEIKDSGQYIWRLIDKDVENHITTPRYRIIDKVSITSLDSSLNNSRLTTSLRVQFTGEMDTVTWTRDGGDLPEGHQLSEFNDTLTVRSTDCGTYRVTVTNSVSEDHAQLTLTAEPAPVSGRFRFSRIAVSIMAAAICAVLLGVFIKRKKLNPDISAWNSLNPV